MRFIYNSVKAAQAAAHLVKLANGKKNLMALLKLLYLADRKALLETGFPITGDNMVAMPNGPVLSRIYDSVKWGRKDSDPWFSYISERANNRVTLVKTNPGRTELSDYEIEVLDFIHAHHGHLDQWQLRDLTHRLPEYVDPNGSSSPINPEDILRAESKSESDIQHFARLAEETYFLGSLTTSAS